MTDRPGYEYEWERDEPLFYRNSTGGFTGLSAQYRTGTTWVVEELQVIVSSARAGLSLKETAVKLRRSPGSVRSRAKKMLPSSDERLNWRQFGQFLVRTPNYDWQSAMRDQGELLITYPTLRKIARLDRDDPETVAKIARMIEIPERARSILFRLELMEYHARSNARGRP